MEAQPPSEIDPDIESELILAMEQLLRGQNLPEERVGALARQIEALSRRFLYNRQQAQKCARRRVRRSPLSAPNAGSAHTAREDCPPAACFATSWFRRAPPRRAGGSAEREPRPDIALFEGDITHLITTAKWSMRQDRETQFQAEYTAYQMSKTQTAELRFALITNEFDVARLNNVARAIPGGAGGYIFHQIYHINPELLAHTHGDRIGTVEHWIGAGKIRASQIFSWKCGTGLARLSYSAAASSIGTKAQLTSVMMPDSVRAMARRGAVAPHCRLGDSGYAGRLREMIGIVERMQPRKFPHSERARPAIVKHTIGLCIECPAKVIRMQPPVSKKIFAAQVSRPSSGPHFLPDR